MEKLGKRISKIQEGLNSTSGELSQEFPTNYLLEKRSKRTHKTRREKEDGIREEACRKRNAYRALKKLERLKADALALSKAGASALSEADVLNIMSVSLVTEFKYFVSYIELLRNINISNIGVFKNLDPSEERYWGPDLTEHKKSYLKSIHSKFCEFESIEVVGKTMEEHIRIVSSAIHELRSSPSIKLSKEIECFNEFITQQERAGISENRQEILLRLKVQQRLLREIYSKTDAPIEDLPGPPPQPAVLAGETPAALSASTTNSPQPTVPAAQQTVEVLSDPTRENKFFVLHRIADGMSLKQADSENILKKHTGFKALFCGLADTNSFKCSKALEKCFDLARSKKPQNEIDATRKEAVALFKTFLKSRGVLEGPSKFQETIFSNKLIESLEREVQAGPI